MTKLEEVLQKIQEFNKNSRVNQQKNEVIPSDNIYCDECGNTGLIEVDEVTVRPCPACHQQRLSYRRLKKGVANIERYMTYTMDNFRTETKEQQTMKAIANKYLTDYDGRISFGVFGKSGAGKTHICIAICHELVKKGQGFYYVEYRSEMDRLKNQQTSYGERALYEERINLLKSVDNLYIDDVFKLFGDVGMADRKELQIMFDIINGRYMNNKSTLFSSECRLNDIIGIDEALGSRIFEMCNGYLVKVEGKNERIRIS